MRDFEPDDELSVSFDSNPHGFNVHRLRDEVPPEQLIEPLPKPPAPPVEMGLAPEAMPAPAASAVVPREAPKDAAPLMTRENVAKAFPGRPSSAPDWKALQAQLERAQDRAGMLSAIDSLHASGGNLIGHGNYKSDPGYAQSIVARAQVPLQMAQAEQQYALNQANIDKAFRPASKDPFAAAKLKLDQDQLAETTRSHKENERIAAQLTGFRDPNANPDSLKATIEAWALSPEGRDSGVTAEALARITTRQDFKNLIDDIKAKKEAKGGGVPVAAKAGDINSVPEQYRAVVKRIIEGRDKAPDPGSRFGSMLLKYASEVDPTFDSTRYGAHKGVVEQQAKDKSLVAVDVAKSHVARARANIPDNFDSRALNRVKQVLQTNSGSDKLSKFELDLLASAHELAAVYGIGNLEGQRAVEHLLDPNQSKAQLIARLDEAEELMKGKIEGAERQRQKYAPGGEAASEKTPTNHGAVAKETKSFRQYADGFIERKSP